MKSNSTEIIEPQKLTSYWKSERETVAFIVISGILYNVGLLLSPILQGKLVDSLIENKRTLYIIMLSLVFVFSVLLVQIFRYIKRFYVRRFANNTSASMRRLLFNNILYKSKDELIKENMGSIMTNAISDVDVCVEGMRKFTTEIFDTGIFVISYIVYMVICDFKITIISCLFVPIAMIMANKLKKVIYRYTISYRKMLGNYTTATMEQIDNAVVFRLYGLEEKNMIKYAIDTDKLSKSAIYSYVWENSMQPVYNVIAMLGIIFVIILGGKNVLLGYWSVGEFISYFNIFVALSFKASKTAKLFNSVQKASVSWNRIKPYLEDRKYTNKNLQNINKDIFLSVKDLKFAYDSDKYNKIKMEKNTLNNKNSRDSQDNEHIKYIIDGFNVSAKIGTIIGITGPIACGKSTFARIFTGEYNYEGNINIGALELSELTEFQRSKLISYSGHNPSLMSDTIYNNITMGDGGSIDNVLRDVCLYDEVKKMTKNIETLVGNGGIKLSGGQQARLSLARCLYRNTPIIVLDDPFSSVDMKTENRILENILNKYSDRIIIIISHRLKIFPKLNKIIVMSSDGRYECGSHNELLNSSALYKELYNLQSCEEVK